MPWKMAHEGTKKTSQTVYMFVALNTRKQPNCIKMNSLAVWRTLLLKYHYTFFSEILTWLNVTWTLIICRTNTWHCSHSTQVSLSRVPCNPYCFTEQTQEIFTAKRKQDSDILSAKILSWAYSGREWIICLKHWWRSQWLVSKPIRSRPWATISLAQYWPYVMGFFRYMTRGGGFPRNTMAFSSHNRHEYHKAQPFIPR